MNSASDAPDGGIQKLPLWDTICLAYSTYFRHFRDVLLICWVWFIVLAPLTAIAIRMQSSWMATVLQLQQGTSPQKAAVSVSMPADLLLPIFGVYLLFAVAGVSIAVAWHRRIILGEKIRFSGNNIVSGNFWRYVGVGIAICLIAFSVLILFMFLSPFFLYSPTDGRNFFGYFAAFVLLYLVGVSVVLRLCLLLPARAVGNLSLSFKEAWNRTRGNTWRIFWGILACALPPGLIIQLAFLFLFGFFDPLSLANPQSFASGSFLPTLSAVGTVFYLLALPIWIGFLSLAYLHFFGRRPDYGFQ